MRSLALAIVAIAAWLAPAAADAQTPDGHEGHRVSPPSAATGQVLSPPPVLANIPLVDSASGDTWLSEVVDTDDPVFVNFIFTSCTTICPVMSAGFAQFHASMRESHNQVRLVSISIDPDVDTVATLRAYAARYRAGRSWRFLTGSRESVDAAQRAFGAYRGDKTNHAPATYFRRSRNAPWQVVNGLSSAAALHALAHGPS